MTEIPHDMILLHILPKLPAKTIARFKSVCKQWNLFLKTPVLENLHHHHVTNNHHQYEHKILVSSREKPFKFFSFACEPPNENLSLSTPFEVDDHFYVSILTSCNGMICLGMIRKCNDSCYVNLILWNPVSSEYKFLSKIGYDSESYDDKYDDKYDCFQMYYNSSKDDYKILRVTGSGNGYIYSLKSDSWRKIVTSGTPQSFRNFYCSTPSVLLDEKIYFLTEDLRLHEDMCIIRFETKTEKFTKLETLSGILQRSEYQTIFVEKGSIHLYVTQYIHNKKRIEVFRTNGDEEWTSMNIYFPNLKAYMEPLHFMRNGNWLMHIDYGLYNMDMDIDYGLHNVDMEKLNNRYHIYSLNEKPLRITGKGKYIETFVSPNRYMLTSISII